MHILTLIIIFVIASIGAACKGDFSGVAAIGKFVGVIALLICVGLLFCYPLLAIIVGAVVATVVICSSSKWHKKVTHIGRMERRLWIMILKLGL